MSIRKFSFTTAIAIVIANMIGTGVFTSLGFQLLDIQSTFVVMMLWLIGGVTALCGALTYAELGDLSSRSGFCIRLDICHGWLCGADGAGCYDFWGLP